MPVTRFLSVRQGLKSAALFGAGLGLIGCAVTSPPVITASNGGSVSAISNVNLLKPDNDQTQPGLLHAALVQEFARRNVEVSSDADTVAEMSYASGPSSMGLYTSQSGEPDTEAAQLAETRKSRWYDACKTVRVRASLALFDRGSGELKGTSSAQSTLCANATPNHAEIAKLLINDALER